MRILIAEDDADVGEVIAAYLEREGYACVRVADGARAGELLEGERFDLLVLDWMMPGCDGLTLLQRVRREQPRLPVLMVSARGQDRQRVSGLEAGADDYLAKPFHPRELVSRVRALLRRLPPADKNPVARVCFGPLQLDFAQGRVELAGQPLTLTATETALLFALAGEPEVALSRQQLLDRVWGSEFAGSERTVDSHLRGLRARLGELPWIEAVWGVGYRFNPRAAE